MNASQLTVIIPTMGDRPELAQTLQSVREAISLQPVARVVLCINAGANSDAVIPILRDKYGSWIEYVTSDEREILPMAVNWNRCLEFARTRCVHLLHDDDFISPYFYSEIQKLMEMEQDAALYVTGAVILGGKNLNYTRIQEHRGEWENAVDVLRNGNPFPFPSVVFDAARLGGFDPKFQFFMDWNAWWRLSESGKVMVSPELLAYYRYHEGNATKELNRRGVNLAEAKLFAAEVAERTGCDASYYDLANICYQVSRGAAQVGDWDICAKQMIWGMREKVRPAFILKIFYHAACTVFGKIARIAR